MAGPGHRRVDLAQGFLAPGFNDCHMHILSFGLGLGQIDVTPGIAPDISTIQQQIRNAATKTNQEWLLGRGYNQNLLAEQRHPNRHDLDAVSAGRRLILWHTSGHVVAVNSATLLAAGITETTPDPAGGEIERDSAGQPTGVLKENARHLVLDVLPPPSRSQAAEAIVLASRALAREGITSASDAATGSPNHLSDELDCYRSAYESGNLQTRMELMPQIACIVPDVQEGPVARPEDFDLKCPREWLRIGPTKIFSDGALTTRTAAVREPYLDTLGEGLLTWSPEELELLIARANGAGWQIATHAIGDLAVELVLKSYEQAASRRSTPSPSRHRIEHCTLLDSEMVSRIRRLGVVPVLQPEDIAVLGDAYEPALGPNRAGNNSPVGWFEEQGVPVAFSSDRPVTPGNPLVGIRAAVERRTPSGMVLGPHHQIDPERALLYYTAGAAYATLTEQNKGRLVPGMLADMVLLDRDITKVPSEAITDARVLMTIVGDREVFRA